MTIVLVVDGIVVPDDNRSQMSQTYKALSAGEVNRVQSGAGLYRGYWSGKIATTVSGQGRLASVLSAILPNQSVVMKCIQSRAVGSSSHIITVPAARRADVPMVGYAITADNDSVETSIDDVTGNVVTLAEVPGAVGYSVNYWPELTLINCQFEDNIEVSDALWGWSLSGEEA